MRSQIIADRIRSWGLFSDASVNVLPKRDSQVIIDVEVNEKPTGSLTFGAGYSSEAGLGVLLNTAKETFWDAGKFVICCQNWQR